jgi:hypothetical protein
LHARTAKTRRARWQRSRRGSRPRLWGSSSRVRPPPVPASGGVRRDPHPPALAASRPLPALHRDEAAVLRPQRSRRGSRPRAWHVLRGRRHTPSLASRPLHARTAMKPPCSRQRARRFPPRAWHAHRDPARPPPALACHARCTLAARYRSRLAPQRARHAPTRAHVGEFVAENHQHAAALSLRETPLY